MNVKKKSVISIILVMLIIGIVTTICIFAFSRDYDNQITYKKDDQTPISEEKLKGDKKCIKVGDKIKEIEFVQSYDNDGYTVYEYHDKDGSKYLMYSINEGVTCLGLAQNDWIETQSDDIEDAAKIFLKDYIDVSKYFINVIQSSPTSENIAVHLSKKIGQWLVGDSVYLRMRKDIDGKYKGVPNKVYIEGMNTSDIGRYDNMNFPDDNFYNKMKVNAEIKCKEQYGERYINGSLKDNQIIWLDGKLVYRSIFTATVIDLNGVAVSDDFLYEYSQ